VRTRANPKSGAMDSRTRVRRVSQRPGLAYSRTKQVTAVTAGSCHATWNLNQATLAAEPTAIDSAAAPATQNKVKKQAAARGRAPGIACLYQLKAVTPMHRPTAKRYGHIWGSWA